MNILKQFESLTKEEILLLSEVIEQSIRVGHERCYNFNETYKLYQGKDVSLIINPDELEKTKLYFDNYAKKLVVFQGILTKINSFKDVFEDN